MKTMIRTYSELIALPSFEERYDYLKLDGSVGIETFGFDRVLNQMLYRSQKWRNVRDRVIIRDNGCDLGVEGYEIRGSVIIHHMNPVTIDDILNQSESLFDIDYLITTTLRTHNAIHYGDYRLLAMPQERSKNDMCPWKHE